MEILEERKQLRHKATSRMELLKENHKKRKVILRTIILATGIIALFLIDGGVSILSAGVIEVVKWSHKNHDTILRIFRT